MDTPPGARIAIIWSSEAQRQLRAIDRDTAMHILNCVDRYSKTKEISRNYNRH